MNLISSNIPIFISSYDEFLQIKSKYVKYQCFTFKCSKCGKEVISKEGNKTLLLFKCKSCVFSEIYSSKEYIEKRKNAIIEKYGSLEEFNKKRNASIEKTCLERYGVNNASKSKEIKEKIKASLQSIDEEQKKINQEKQKKTMLERYGVEVFSQSEELRKKGEQTRLEKYGDKNFNNREKYKQTCLERFGVDNSFKSESVREKWAQGMLEKYGTTHPYFGHSFYKYDDIIFDSSWELIYFCFLKLENKSFQYHPKRIPYFIKNKKHFYEPDFEVDGQLIEIKGPQFFNEEGHLRDPWSGKILLEKESCMKENNVVIISDIEEFKKIVLGHFGLSFIDDCKLLR